MFANSTTMGPTVSQQNMAASLQHTSKTCKPPARPRVVVAKASNDKAIRYVPRVAAAGLALLMGSSNVAEAYNTDSAFSEMSRAERRAAIAAKQMEDELAAKEAIAERKAEAQAKLKAAEEEKFALEQAKKEALQARWAAKGGKALKEPFQPPPSRTYGDSLGKSLPQEPITAPPLKGKNGDNKSNSAAPSPAPAPAEVKLSPQQQKEAALAQIKAKKEARLAAQADTKAQKEAALKAAAEKREAEALARKEAVIAKQNAPKMTLEERVAAKEAAKAEKAAAVAARKLALEQSALDKASKVAADRAARAAAAEEAKIMKATAAEKAAAERSAALKASAEAKQKEKERAASEASKSAVKTKPAPTKKAAKKEDSGIGSTLGAVGLLGAGTWLLFNEDEKKEADDLESAARIAETKANAKRAEAMTVDKRESAANSVVSPPREVADRKNKSDE
mmetsp:Transcript_7445/g.14071  ORF Transcript_7445/g.14071 Transcript_7445/m.14071 type:complete len:451 (-) Transcript_7445:291-1643(-)